MYAHIYMCRFCAQRYAPRITEAKLLCVIYTLLSIVKYPCFGRQFGLLFLPQEKCIASIDPPTLPTYHGAYANRIGIDTQDCILRAPTD